MALLIFFNILFLEVGEFISELLKGCVGTLRVQGTVNNWLALTGGDIDLSGLSFKSGSSNIIGPGRGVVLCFFRRCT